MKKAIIFSLVICFVLNNPLNAQKSGILKKVGNSMANELLGIKEKPAPDPEPASACAQPETIMDMGGKYKLNYKEINISVTNDGRVLVQDRTTGKYYVIQGNVTTGPYNSDDPRVAGFEAVNDDDKNIDGFILRNKPYISKSGEKLLITFGGKTYGPYALINSFIVSKTKEKFAAFVTENVLATEAEAKKMEKAMQNAKTDQEKMDLTMQYAQQMQEKMVANGGISTTQPKLVTNIPGATYDPLTSLGSVLNGKMKYDDILLVAYNKIIDLQGKTVLTFKPEVVGGGELFINTDNTKYAVFDYGKLTFSDKTALPDMFNPYLTKVDGKIYLTYMYYSPKKNSIMQCKILF